MDIEEKEKILLQFLKNDKIYLAALLYVVPLAFLTNFIITLLYDLFREQLTFQLKLFLFLDPLLFIIIIFFKTYYNFKSINKRFNYLLHKYKIE